MTPITRAWWKDTLERLVWTFVQGALGTTGTIELVEAITKRDLELGFLFSMLAGGVGAVLAFVKSLAAKRLSEGGTAQLGAQTYSYTESGPGAAGDLP